MNRILGKAAVAGALVFAAQQTLRPGIPVKQATAQLQTPAEVKRVLDPDCYSCHSDERRLSWFDQIVPAYWLVRHDILTTREHLNFWTLGSKPGAAQKAALFSLHGQRNRPWSLAAAMPVRHRGESGPVRNHITVAGWRQLREGCRATRSASLLNSCASPRGDRQTSTDTSQARAFVKNTLPQAWPICVCLSLSVSGLHNCPDLANSMIELRICRIEVRRNANPSLRSIIRQHLP